MSNTDYMLEAVLRMPPNLWSGSEIDVMQRHSRYVQAAEELASLKQQLAEAKQETKELRNAIDQEMVIAHLGVFNRGDDPVKAIKELMLWSQGVGEYFAKDKLAALKCENEELRKYLIEAAQDEVKFRLLWTEAEERLAAFKASTDRCIKAIESLPLIEGEK